MSGFKNDHYRQCGVFVLAGDDASHSDPPPLLPPFQSWGVLGVALLFLENMVLFFIPLGNTFKAVHNSEMGGGGGSLAFGDNSSV